MTVFQAFLWTFAGVLISFILPPLFKAAGIGGNLNPGTKLKVVLPALKTLLTNRYVVTTILSLVVSLIVVALLGNQIDTWNLALINGLGWQSIIARVVTT